MRLRSNLVASVALVAALTLASCTKKPKEEPTPAIAEVAAAPTPAPMSQEEKEQVLDKAIEIAFNTVYFDFDSHQLTPAAVESMQQIVEGLRLNPEVKLQIVGHADQRGSSEYNLALSEKRSNSIKEFLVSQGIPAANLESFGKGKEEPAVQGSGEEVWAKNRRGEFVRL